MPGIEDVAVEAIAESSRPMLERLVQLYLHDFSGFARLGTPFGEVDEDGRFAYPPGLDV